MKLILRLVNVLSTLNAALKFVVRRILIKKAVALMIAAIAF
ncbi:MAG: hypothetical protein UV95_C0001G0404 [Candidatus Falkowbacteria bacterium GW2011_GWF2_43_32]|nr:MAG: hypothetical protein UV95_C0001G0404 [Candidatus Falkowbacteria bacterium GW2011_GWF2_43_32]